MQSAKSLPFIYSVLDDNGDTIHHINAKQFAVKYLDYTTAVEGGSKEENRRIEDKIKKCLQTNAPDSKKIPLKQLDPTFKGNDGKAIYLTMNGRLNLLRLSSE